MSDEEKSGSEKAQIEQGLVLPVGETPIARQVLVVPQGNGDVAMAVGRIEAKLESVEKRLDKIEEKSDDIIRRLERLESLFNALEKLPKPVGPAIKSILDARIKK